MFESLQFAWCYVFVYVRKVHLYFFDLVCIEITALLGCNREDDPAIVCSVPGDDGSSWITWELLRICDLLESSMRRDIFRNKRDTNLDRLLQKK